MNNSNAYIGVGVFDVLGIIFVVLKLCNVITWSWLWVTSPFWIPIGIWLVCLVVVLVIVAIKERVYKIRHRRY